MKKVLIIFLSILLIGGVFAETDNSISRVSDIDGSISRIPDISPALGIRGVSSSSSSSSSGGGGGSSSSSSSDNVKSDNYIPIPEKAYDEIKIEPLKPIQKKLSSGSNYKFKIKNSQEHKLLVKQVTPNNVTIELQSDPIVTTFNIGESKLFDLDNNGFNELKITLESIDYPDFNLIMEELIEETEIVSEIVGNDNSDIINDLNNIEENENLESLDNLNDVDEDLNKASEILFILGIILIAVIITVIIGVIIYHSNHKHLYSSQGLNQSEINLLNYIKNEREAGYSDSQIKDVCIRSGWNERIVDELLKK